MSEGEEDDAAVVAAPTTPNPKGVPKWIVQIVAWATGIGGLYLDYGLNIFGTTHLPWFIYALSVGVGYGIDPDVFPKFFGGGKK